MMIPIALFAGALFGAGLTISQMIDPRVVLGFLDLRGIADGTWNPTLMMVFIGALPVMFAAYRIRTGMHQPLAAPVFAIPDRRDIDARLIAGSTLFGIGWGLAGICPGPALTAITAVGSQLPDLLVFIACMIAGIALANFPALTRRVPA
jgi:uncharacterized protein